MNTSSISAPTAAPTVCVCCNVKSVVLNSSTCSKRCDWMCQTSCPQCGRGRLPNYTFCSGLCAGEARHANWCVYCGVRQLEYGHTTCMAPNCASQHAYMQAQPLPPMQHRGPAHRMSHGNRHATPNELLSAGDKIRRTAEAHFTQLVDGVHAVAKVGGPAATRKRYLAYRGNTEDDLAATVGRGAPKYGHGGEGNEQRRFIPLQLTCPGAVYGTADPCADPQCEACTVLRSGLTLSALNRPTHFVTSTPAAAVSLSAPTWVDGTAVSAVAVCRAVVGHPLVVADSSEVLPVAPTAPFHSLIVSDGDTRNDSTFLYRDDAVDVQFIVYFTPRMPAQ